MFEQERSADPRADLDSLSRLSPREREVLELTSHGLTNMQIAGSIHVSVHAVKFHLHSVFSKLGVSNRTEAAVLHLRSGLQDRPAD